MLCFNCEQEAKPVKALVYLGSTDKALQERPKPGVTAPTDAIVKMTLTTVCGTDLHILKGDVATCEPGRILGHEGVGVVEEVGAAVTMFKPGDRVLISCIIACGKCVFCRKLMYSHCVNGGWILGNKIDGTQAEFVRIPYAETSLYPIPTGADEASIAVSTPRPPVIVMTLATALPSPLLTPAVAPKRLATSRRLSSRSIMMISAGE
jgi:alcohol dehydrogenase